MSNQDTDEEFIHQNMMEYAGMNNPPIDPNTIDPALRYKKSLIINQPEILPLDHANSLPIQWLWPGRIALGKLTLLVGDPGVGKSFITLDLAARTSRGGPWPGVAQPPPAVPGCTPPPFTGEGLPCEASAKQGGPEGRVRVLNKPRPPAVPNSPCAKPGGVLLLSAEDDVADTIRPRLEAAGADLTRIISLQWVKKYTPSTGRGRTEPFSLAHHMGALDQATGELENARLVIIDPLSAYLGDDDTNNSARMSPIAPAAGAYGQRVRSGHSGRHSPAQKRRPRAVPGAGQRGFYGRRATAPTALCGIRTTPAASGGSSCPSRTIWATVRMDWPFAWTIPAKANPSWPGRPSPCP